MLQGFQDVIFFTTLMFLGPFYPRFNPTVPVIQDNPFYQVFWHNNAKDL